MAYIETPTLWIRLKFKKGHTSEQKVLLIDPIDGDCILDFGHTHIVSLKNWYKEGENDYEFFNK
jgi:hypothetical protein